MTELTEFELLALLELVLVRARTSSRPFPLRRHVPSSTASVMDDHRFYPEEITECVLRVCVVCFAGGMRERACVRRVYKLPCVVVSVLVVVCVCV